jgi:hypothetical protein
MGGQSARLKDFHKIWKDGSKVTSNIFTSAAVKRFRYKNRTSIGVIEKPFSPLKLDYSNGRNSNS